MQQRLREHLDLTMRAAQHAEKVLRSTDIGDEDAADGMTQLIDDVTKKHDNIRHEMGQLGVTVPISHTAGLSEALTTGAGTGAGRRMQFERQIVDIKEACVQLKEMMEYEDNVEGYDNIEDAATSVSGGRGGGAAFKDIDSATTMSQIHENDDSDDDDSKAVMTPRGVYVQRCLCVPLLSSRMSNSCSLCLTGTAHSQATPPARAGRNNLQPPALAAPEASEQAPRPLSTALAGLSSSSLHSAGWSLIVIQGNSCPHWYNGPATPVSSPSCLSRLPIQAPILIITVQQTTHIADVLCINHRSIPLACYSNALIWEQQSVLSP